MDKTAKELVFEAFGPVNKKPYYLYSRNNLRAMYGVSRPKEIIAARVKKLDDFGYNPDKDKFSKEEFEIMLFFDYLEALMASYRLRAQAASFRAPLLNMGTVTILGEPSDKAWDLRPLIRMLSIFCCTLEICGMEVQALKKKRLPACLEAWRWKLSDDMDHDYAFYQDWKRNCIGDVTAGLLKRI